MSKLLVIISNSDKSDNKIDNRRLVSPVGKAPDNSAGGLGSTPCRTNTQGLKIIEKVPPLFIYLQMVRLSRLLG